MKYKAQQILFTKSYLQVTVILNVNEFHLVVNSSTCGITLKRITQQLHDVMEIINQSGNYFRVLLSSYVVLCQ